MGPVVACFLGYGSGLVTGWIARNISDSPQGATVKLIEAAQDAKDRVVLWTSLQRERIEDMLAEVRASNAEGSPRSGPPDDEKDGVKAKDKTEKARSGPSRKERNGA